MNSRNVPAVVLDQANMGGIADSLYSGQKGSLAKIVGFDLHSVPGLMVVNQRLAKHSGTTVDDLVKIVPCTDGNIYLFGKTTGKVWKIDNAGAYTLLGTINTADATQLVYPSTVVDDATVGTQSWLTPAVAEVEGEGGITEAGGLTSSVSSHYLKCTNFGFNIPVGATILGVQVQVKVSTDRANQVQDNHVHLVKGGTIQTPDASNATQISQPLVAYVKYGSDQLDFRNSDPFSVVGNYTPADINASTFGFVISFIGRDGTATKVDIDAVKMMVIYQPAASGVLDAREYMNYIYYAQAGRYVGKWKVGTAFSARGDSAYILDNGDETYHPMEEQNVVLYIGDGNKVAQIDSSSAITPNDFANPIFSPAALTLENSYQIQSLGKYFTSLLVGARATANNKKSGVFDWNTWSVSFDKVNYVDEDGVNAIMNGADSSVLISVGVSGNLYSYSSLYGIAHLNLVKQIPPDFPTLYAPTQQAVVHHSAVGNKEGIPLFGYSTVTGNPALQGIYSYGSRNVSYPAILLLEFPISTGNVNNITIWSMAFVGSDMYVSWMDTTSGSPVYGVDKLDFTTKINGAYFESRVMRYTKVLLEEFKKFIINYNSNPANTSISLYYKVNHGSYVLFDPAQGDIVNDTDRVQWRAERNINAKTLQLKVVMNSSGNDAPSIEELITQLE